MQEAIINIYPWLFVFLYTTLGVLSAIKVVGKNCGELHVWLKIVIFISVTAFMPIVEVFHFIKSIKFRKQKTLKTN